MGKPNFVAGMQVGDFILRRRVIKKDASPATRTQWRVECVCGIIITIPQFYMTRKGNPKTHCGCKSKTVKTLNKREYSIWTMMRRRCNDPNHVSYSHYGGRGISVCTEWDTLDGGFERFFEHIGNAPSRSHTLDRIDNDGNYEPGNVRWATPTEQAANKGRKK